MNDAFEYIYGQPQVRDFLRASVIAERVTQAYLFVGPAGSNKLEAAKALARALLCPKGPLGPRGGACGACDRCRRIEKGKHPDVHYYAPDGAQGYLVGQIRDIVDDTARAPIQANKKIYIIDRADLLNASAANAFLKTLEEPPEDVVMILLARSRETVLPTILSRCQVVPFRHIPPLEAAGIVVQNTGADIEQARYALEACSGSITKAKQFLDQKNHERLNFRVALFADLARLKHCDDWDVLEIARSWVKNAGVPLAEEQEKLEAEVEEYKDFLAKSALRQIELRNKRQISAKTFEYLRQTTALVRSWLRDGLMVALHTPDLMVNKDVADAIQSLFVDVKADKVVEALACVDTCDEALTYNVSQETCFDALLFEVREVFA